MSSAAQESRLLGPMQFWPLQGGLDDGCGLLPLVWKNEISGDCREQYHTRTFAGQQIREGFDPHQMCILVMH